MQSRSCSSEKQTPAEVTRELPKLAYAGSFGKGVFQPIRLTTRA